MNPLVDWQKINRQLYLGKNAKQGEEEEGCFSLSYVIVNIVGWTKYTFENIAFLFSIFWYFIDKTIK